MAKPKRKSAVAAPKRRAKTEQWCGIRRELEHYECDEDTGAVFRPDVVAWINADGKVRATSSVSPATPDDCLAELLEEAEREPLPGSGDPGRADMLVVEDESLRDAVLRMHTGRVVRVDEATVADEYVASLIEEFGSAEDVPHETLAEEELVSREAIARYLAAFGRFYAAAPWDALAEQDAPVMRIAIPSLGVDNGCIVFFADDEERGVSFSMSPDDLSFGGGELPRDERPHGMRYFEGTAEPERIVDPARIEELDGFGVSRALYRDWCPGLSTFDYDYFKRPLVPDELRLATVCVEALGKLLRMPGAPVATPPEVTLTVTLEGEATPFVVTFTTPHPDVDETDDAEDWDEEDNDLEALDELSQLSPDDQARVREMVEALFPTPRVQGRGILLGGASNGKPVAPPRANDPCPCGSGKRYKDCHRRD